MHYACWLMTSGGYAAEAQQRFPLLDSGELPVGPLACVINGII